jgi:hypothetical protein
LLHDIKCYFVKRAQFFLFFLFLYGKHKFESVARMITVSD